MDQLDHLGWVAGISFVSYGLRVGVRVTDPVVLDDVADRLPPGWRPARSPIVDALYSLRVGGPDKRRNVRNLHLLYAGSRMVGRSREIEHVLDALEGNVRLTVATMSNKGVFLHAGVVGWHGGAIIIPGRSGTGKTTLVAALVRAGAVYYSDEYAVIDARGWIEPYLTPMSIREGSTRRRCRPADIGGRAGASALPPRVVLLTHYEQGARWSPRALGPAQAMLALADNAVAVRNRPEATMGALRRVAETTPVLRGRRGEAERLIELLPARLAASPRPSSAN